MLIKRIDKSVIARLKNIMEKADSIRLNELDYDDSFVHKQADIPYIRDDKRGHLLDIYSLKGHNKNTPVIVNIHGGGLIYGYKEINRSFNCELARRGFKVVSLNYELLPETTLLGQLRDISSAMRFIYINRKKYELNFKKLFLVGDSAGGLLCYMFASICCSKELQQVFDIKPHKINIKALGLISIMLDTNRKLILRAIRHFIVGDDEKKSNALEYLINPQEMNAAIPKTFLITSGEDIIREETLRLFDLLKEREIPCVLHDEPRGKNHMLPHVYPVAYPLYKESSDTIDMMCDFFNS